MAIISCTRDSLPDLIACLQHVYKKLDGHVASGKVTVKGTSIEIKFSNGSVEIKVK